VFTADPDIPTGLSQTYDPDEANPCVTFKNEGTRTITVGSIHLDVDYGYRVAGTNTINGTVSHEENSGGHTG
jgi:hypothetical protein